MNSQKNIQDELKDLDSILPAHNGQPVFSVPEGYFDSLAASILAKVKNGEASAVQELAALSPMLAGISRETPYSVPLFYFEQNLDGLQGIMNTTPSPLLESIGKEMPFTVPQGYFTNLSAKVISKVAPPTAKIIPLFARSWMRAAVAAVVGGIIFISGYQYFNSKNADPIAQTRVDTARQNQFARNEPAMVQEIKKASTKELDEFIENVQIASVKKVKGNFPSSDDEKVKALLQDVTDTEMDAFLNAIPTADDELSVTN